LPAAIPLPPPCPSWWKGSSASVFVIGSFEHSFDIRASSFVIFPGGSPLPLPQRRPLSRK
jgi:hypothetical protein